MAVSDVPICPSLGQRTYALCRRSAWIGFIGSIAFFGWAWLWPDDGGDRSGVALALAYVRFQARTFCIHAGIGWLMLGVLAIVLSSRRLALACLAAGAVSMTPIVWSRVRTVPSDVKSERANATLSVLTSNLLLVNRDYDAILAEVGRCSPDVILFQEYTPQHAVGLRAALELTHPFIIESPRRDSCGQAIYSRFEIIGEPLVSPQREFLEREGFIPRTRGFYGIHDPQLRVVVRVPDGVGSSREVIVQNVHMPTPVSLAYFREQRAMARWLAEWATQERTPTIVAATSTTRLTVCKLDYCERPAPSMHSRSLAAAWAIRGPSADGRRMSRAYASISAGALGSCR